MTISTGKTRLRVFQSALANVKYVHDKPISWAGHDDAIRNHRIKEAMNKNDRYNTDC